MEGPNEGKWLRPPGWEGPLPLSDAPLLTEEQLDRALEELFPHEHGEKGSEESGHWGHRGRPGQRGGSQPGPGRYAAPSEPQCEAVAGTIGLQNEHETEVNRGRLEQGFSELTAELSEDERWEDRTPWQADYQNANTQERGAVKHHVVTKLAEKAGVSYEEANRFVKQWSYTANDRDMRSLAIQEDSKAIGGRLSEWQQGKIAMIVKDIERRVRYALSDPSMIGKEPGSTITEAEARAWVYKHADPGRLPLMDRSTQKKLLRAMYDNTQEYLAGLGFKPTDRIRVFRGTTISPPQYDQYVRPGDTIEFQDNAMSSWTMDLSDAIDFTSKRSTQGTRQGVTMETTVPVSEIVSLAVTGMGCLTEGEVIIRNAGGTAGIVKAYSFRGEELTPWQR